MPVAGLEVGEPVTALLPHGGSAEAVWVPADLQLPLPQGISPVAAAALRSFVAVVRGAGGADAAFDAIGGEGTNGPAEPGG